MKWILMITAIVLAIHLWNSEAAPQGMNTTNVQSVPPSVSLDSPDSGRTKPSEASKYPGHDLASDVHFKTLNGFFNNLISNELKHNSNEQNRAKENVEWRILYSGPPSKWFKTSEIWKDFESSMKNNAVFKTKDFLKLFNLKLPSDNGAHPMKKVKPVELKHSKKVPESYFQFSKFPKSSKNDQTEYNRFSDDVAALSVKIRVLDGVVECLYWIVLFVLGSLTFYILSILGFLIVNPNPRIQKTKSYDKQRTFTV